MFILLMLKTAYAACESPTRATDVAGTVSGAQLAMASLDMDGFAAAVALARGSVPCLAEVLSPLDAASYHGLMGLAAFSGDREEESVLWFAAAQAVTPSFKFPSVIAPPGGPLEAVLARARASPLGTMQPVPPYDGRVLVDGSPGVLRPADRPCVLQLIRADGTVARTYVLLPGDALPFWEPPPTPMQRFVPKIREKPSVPFGIAAGGSAAVAGGLYALGGVWHAQYLDSDTPYEDLQGLETRTNAALGASIALGVAAAALTTVTFVRW